jgi:hypothetical protein
MKRHLRLWFVLLISLVLPVNGMAAFEMGIEPCQMAGSQADLAELTSYQPHGMHSMAGLQAGIDPAHENAEDDAPCPSGLQCKSPGMLVLELARSVPTGAPSAVTAYFPDHIPTSAGDNHWRPPRI